ncbi:MAG: fumarylacetoacetate hydrolase family protein [Gammaproteobacteria bacterium]|nr:fumarylacetoacetate hydrolase family protein [Gammaproteobacteria bacterium]
MIVNPEKIHRGMHQQLLTWRDCKSNQEYRLGWKIGFNMVSDQKRLNLPSAMVGHLSRQRELSSGQHFQAPVNSNLLVEPEIAIQIGRDINSDISHVEAKSAISSYTAALELVDTTRSVADDIEAVLTGNLFHEGVILAEQRVLPDDYRRNELAFTLTLNGEPALCLEQERVPEDFSTIIVDTAKILAEHGEQLQAGDWIITGSAAKPLPVKAGDHIALDMQSLGKIDLHIK